MASVQTAPAAQQPGNPTPMPPQDIKALYLKYKQMKDQGVSETDPEFIKVHNHLQNVQQNIQQQRIFNQQRAAFAQQQQQMLNHQQQQQQNAALSSATPNGINARTATNSSPTTQAPTATSLGPSAIPASGAKGAVQRNTTAGSGYFSPEQLSILKNQIFAFKCLSRNQGIPQAVQQSLFAVQQKKMMAAVEQTLQAAATGGEDAKSQTDGIDTAAGDKDTTAMKKHEYIGFKSPRSGLMAKISYSAHNNREMRPMIPSIMPSGVDVEKLRNERETIVYNRMQARLAELRSLPANVAHWDTRNEDLTPEDTLKRKALIEMKMLGLYAKQRAMRERISRQMIQYDNLAMTANRSHYRRMKKQSLREARITEKLEKQS